MKNIGQRATQQTEAYHTEDHEENAADPLCIRCDWNVSVPNSCDRSNCPVERHEVLFVCGHFTEFALHPGVLIVFRKTSEEDPEASHDMSDHQEHKSNEKQPFEAKAKANHLSDVLQQLWPLFDDL